MEFWHLAVILTVVVVGFFIATFTGLVSQQLISDMARSIRWKAAMMFVGFAAVVAFCFGIGWAYGLFGGTSGNVLGFSSILATVLFLFHKDSPLAAPLNLLRVVHLNEFAEGDVIRIHSMEGRLVYDEMEVERFELKGITCLDRLKRGTVIPHSKILHSYVMNLTPKDIFGRTSKVTISRTVETSKIINGFKHSLKEQGLDCLYGLNAQGEEEVLETATTEPLENGDPHSGFCTWAITTWHNKYDENNKPTGYWDSYHKHLNLIGQVKLDLDVAKVHVGYEGHRMVQP